MSDTALGTAGQEEIPLLQQVSVMETVIMNKSCALITRRGGGQMGSLLEAQKSYERIIVTGQG